ncbi:MAG: hypothetical protein QF664_02940 [Dehalococcoidia bacterium]|jgi:hypothetical protein|nr:hypothetical protein [Dehalococcoidia bacterium]
MLKPAAVFLAVVATIQFVTLRPAASTPFHGDGQGEVDALMERALESRAENWLTLHDYILDERETLTLEGPGAVNLYGFDHEFTWYIRDGFLIRSPVRYDGVAIDGAEREEFEAEWLRDERRRYARAEERDVADESDVDTESVEPRLISEANFFDFEFEPGNYYFAGREILDGHEVLIIEYYPTRFAADEDEEWDEPTDDEDEKREREREREMENMFAKTSLVTMWVDPEEAQIVKFTFENVGFDFLPLRWLVRVDEMRASMVMSQPFDGVWLPEEITMRGRVTSAYGSLQMAYTRAFSNYKEAEVSATIRSFRPPGE